MWWQRKGGGRYPNKNASYTPKIYVSPVAGVENDTFNTGHSKFASQFKTSKRNVTNFVQWLLTYEVHIAAETIKTGKVQTIVLPPAIPEGTTDAEKANARDDNIFKNVQISAIGKRSIKLEEALNKGFAIVYNQCSEGVKSKLKASANWDQIEANQSLHNLINTIQKNCVGHDDTNQDMYNVVQACKNIFLFWKEDRTSTEDYLQDFKSYWDTCEAYKAEPAHHPQIVKARLGEIAPNPMTLVPTNIEKTQAESEIKEEFMAGLVISSTNQKCFGILTRDLQNSYLKGQDDYPKTFEEAKRLLSN